MLVTLVHAAGVANFAYTIYWDWFVADLPEKEFPTRYKNAVFTLCPPANKSATAHY